MDFSPRLTGGRTRCTRSRIQHSTRHTTQSEHYCITIGGECSGGGAGKLYAETTEERNCSQLQHSKGNLHLCTNDFRYVAEAF